MYLKQGMYLKPAECEIGEAYDLIARNIRVGIWDGHGFHGIRHKFGVSYMDVEVHYDVDEHHGTAQPVRKLD